MKAFSGLLMMTTLVWGPPMEIPSEKRKRLKTGIRMFANLYEKIE